jgi:hypothetical protein
MTPVRATLTLVLVFLAAAVLAAQSDAARDALALGRSHDDAMVASFHSGYVLTASGPIDRVEIITEFRRAVLLVGARALQGNYSFGADDLNKAMAPFRGLLTVVVQVRLHPLHTLIKEPAYDVYIAAGPASPPIAARTRTREPVYPPGAAFGSPIAAVRLEASFPRGAIESAAAPMLTVIDEKADPIWQVRLDLSRYR